MKKFISTLIAVVMAFSMVTVAFAADLTAETISSKVTKTTYYKNTYYNTSNRNLKLEFSDTQMNNGIYVIDFTFNTPDFSKVLSSATFTIYNGKKNCDIATVNAAGVLRLPGGYKDTNAVFESNTNYDIKIVVYADTSVLDFYYKKSTDSKYIDVTTMGGQVDMSGFRTRFSEGNELATPIYFNFASFKLNTGEQNQFLCIDPYVAYRYAKASDALTSKDLFETYYNACKDAGIVTDTLTITDETFAQLKSVFTEKNITTNEAILANAAPLAAVLDVCGTDYKDYKTVSTKISSAKAQAAKLVANGVYTNLSPEIKKVDLLDSLQACKNEENAAGMRLYTSGSSAYADSVFVGKGGIVFIAAYNDNKELVGASTVEEAVFAEGDTSKEKQAQLATLPAGTTLLKAFTWDSLNTINPIRGNLEIGIN